MIHYCTWSNKNKPPKNKKFSRVGLIVIFKAKCEFDFSGFPYF
jgi:hypothetical protein